MADEHTDDGEQTAADVPTDLAAAAALVTSTYKILGQTDAPEGTAILGQNDANSGSPVGVEGAVPNTSGGYGLSTPDDARIEGRVVSTSTHEIWVGARRQMRLDPYADDYQGNTAAGNVLGGFGFADDGVVGAAMGNGGSLENTNEVYADYATVAGGEGNQAGKPSTSGSGSSIRATVGGGANNTANSLQATVGGGVGNTASSRSATVGGGTDNTASFPLATVSGGQSNVAKDFHAVVGGGEENVASGVKSTVGGGAENDASNSWTAVAGGERNEASSNYAFVGGGFGNEASGYIATVPGGLNNTASGAYSVAAGRKANTSGYDGTFVFGDSSDTEIQAQGSDEARFQTPVYAPAHNTTSARAAKTAIEPVDPADVLAGVRSLSISTWEFVDTDDGRHMGPMAGDFRDTFELGTDDGHISTVDSDGVALAAIQGLAERLETTREELADARAELDERDERIEDLADENDRLREENDRLRERVAAIEDRLGIDP